MDAEIKLKIQQRISSNPGYWLKDKHEVRSLPSDFRPWTCDLSPSALYNCALKCRKQAGIKTFETKWVSIKRWLTTTSEGIELPPGVFFSIKRHEAFIPRPEPHFVKTEYILLMFPFGNTWSQIKVGVPITEEWLWSEEDGMLMFEHLMMKDAAEPLNGYFERVHEYMINNPDQIGIHLKRKKKSQE